MSLVPAKRVLKALLLKVLWEGRRRLFVNREGLEQFNFELAPRFSHTAGVSAMLRVKNEEKKIEACLESIYPVFDELVIVDNGSTDATRNIIQAFVHRKGSARVRVFEYPHAVSRCGADNTATPEDSVHSLAYYYNWCLSKCSHRWIFKWDGDMVLPRDKLTLASQILQEAQSSATRLWWNVEGQTVYIDRNGKAWASKEEVNHEVMCFPNSPAFYYRKGELWEVLSSPFYIDEELRRGVIFYEIKDTRDDEFSHWTDLTALSPRKVIEYRNFSTIRDTACPQSDRFAPLELDSMFQPRSGGLG